MTLERCRACGGPMILDPNYVPWCLDLACPGDREQMRPRGERPPTRARLLGRLIGAVVLALIASAALGQEVEPAAPVAAPAPPPLGGCWGARGAHCAGPTLMGPMFSLDLANGRADLAADLGVAYGVTWFRDRWFAAGVKGFLGFRPGASYLSFGGALEFGRWFNVGVRRLIVGGQGSTSLIVGPSYAF